MKSQLIILAAGVGSRLKPLTNNIPKTMVEINSKPMIDYILSAIDPLKFEEIIIAVGHKQEKIVNYLGTSFKSIPITYVYNPEYKVTNSIYSMWLLKKLIKKDFVVINADTIFDARILENLMNSEESILVSVDDNISTALDEDAMKVTIKENKIIDIRKTILPENTMGDAIGIYRFKNEGVDFLFKEIEECLEKSINDQLFTHAVNNLTSKTKITPISTLGYNWYEIDSAEDLKIAEDKIVKFNIFKESKGPL